MACSLSVSRAPVVSRAAAFSQRSMTVRAPTVRPVTKKNAVVANMGAIEVAQVAGEAAYIGGVAGVMFGVTLVGLALGFVLLRVESLTEEGKI